MLWRLVLVCRLGSILNYMGDPRAYQRLLLYPLAKPEPGLEDVLWAIAASGPHTHTHTPPSIHDNTS